MSQRSNIGFYHDEDCRQLFGQKIVEGQAHWLIDFGRIDAGEEKTSCFYVRNLSEDIIEDLSIAVEPVDREGVLGKVVSNKYVARLEPGESRKVEVEWSATAGVKVGLCQGDIVVRGTLVADELVRI